VSTLTRRARLRRLFFFERPESRLSKTPPPGFPGAVVPVEMQPSSASAARRVAVGRVSDSQRTCVLRRILSGVLASVALLCVDGTSGARNPSAFVSPLSGIGAGPQLEMHPRVCAQRGAVFGGGIAHAVQQSRRLAGPSTKLRMDTDSGKQTGLPSANAPDSGEMFSSSVNTEDETDEYGMSMMGGLDQDLTKDTDKVRVFGANLDSKFASRGRGLQQYEVDEGKVDPKIIAKLLEENDGDLEKAKKALKIELGRSKKAEEIFRVGVKLMQVRAPPACHHAVLK